MATLIQTTSRKADLEMPRSYRRLPSIHARIAVKWEAIVNFLVPIGYEDEAGFHYGKQAAPQDGFCVTSMEAGRRALIGWQGLNFSATA